jgi:hypothetical protein
MRNNRFIAFSCCASLWATPATLLGSPPQSDVDCVISTAFIASWVAGDAKLKVARRLHDGTQQYFVIDRSNAIGTRLMTGDRAEQIGQIPYNGKVSLRNAANGESELLVGEEMNFPSPPHCMRKRIERALSGSTQVQTKRSVSSSGSVSPVKRP